MGSNLIADNILQRKLPRRVYREIGEIRSELENITLNSAGRRTLNSPMFLRLRVRVRDSDATGTSKEQLEKSHFLSFQSFALPVPRFCTGSRRITGPSRRG